MSHNISSSNYINNMNNPNVNLNANIISKFNKINRQNYKTISIHNSTGTNYIKYNHSKDNIQLTNNPPEKRKKSSNNKNINNKKEKKNFIPKVKTDILNIQNSQISQNNEANIDNNLNNNILNNNLKNKKDYQFNRPNSSHHQKSNDLYDKNSKEVNLLRKKLLIGNNSNNNNHTNINGNINNSNKHIPRANERLNSNDNNNSGSKLIKRSNTNNFNENNINNNYNSQIHKYKNIIKVLVYYIENLNKKIKSFFNKSQIEKNNKIKELSLQNKFLINENKTLKIKIIQFFYIMKIYMKNGKKLYNEKYHKLIKGLILENKYLRGINILPKNINNDYLSKLKKQIQIEKIKKELIIHNQLLNKAENNSNNKNPENQNNNNNKEINNPFIPIDENALNNLNNKISHKRQRTHFNLGKLNEDNNNSYSNRDSIGSNHNLPNDQSSVSSNTVVDNKDKDKEGSYNKHIRSNSNNSKSENIFCEALKEMSNYNKTLRKMNNNSKKNILENKSESNGNENIKINKVGNKIICNIPFNMNKNEQHSNFNVQNDKGDSRKISKIEIKQDNRNTGNYLVDKGNENAANKKQQSIYYRSAREKEKKKIEFTK